MEDLCILIRPDPDGPSSKLKGVLVGDSAMQCSFYFLGWKEIFQKNSIIEALLRSEVRFRKGFQLSFFALQELGSSGPIGDALSG